MARERDNEGLHCLGAADEGKFVLLVTKAFIILDVGEDRKEHVFFYCTFRRVCAPKTPFLQEASISLEDRPSQ